MKTQFKNGDKVRLKKNLKVGKRFGGYELRESMVFDGIKEIERVTPVSCFIDGWFYAFEMLIKTK